MRALRPGRVRGRGAGRREPRPCTGRRPAPGSRSAELSRSGRGPAPAGAGPARPLAPRSTLCGCACAPRLLALAAGVALADGSIVTLGLPQILGDLNTTVEGVAAVIGVYTLVLALALLPLERAAGRVSVRAIGAGGLALMAAASVLCALSTDLTTLLAGRALQALGGAGGLIAVFAILGGGEGAGPAACGPARRSSGRPSGRRSAAC